MKKIVSLTTAAIMMATSISTVFAGVSPVDQTPNTLKELVNAFPTYYAHMWKRANVNQKLTRSRADFNHVFRIAKENANTTPADAGKLFIILDEHEMQDGSGKKEYLIMTYDGYGYQTPDTTDSQRFDPNSQTNIGYKMNSPTGTWQTAEMKKDDTETPISHTSHSLMSDEGWISESYVQNYTVPGDDGYGKFTLPKQIRNYINTNHEWTEDGTADTPESQPYKFTAGITMLSSAEARQYKDIFGYNDGTQINCITNNEKPGEAVSWRLRTQTVDANNRETAYCVNDGAFWTAGTNSKRIIRPVFYVTEDFFKNVKLNVSQSVMGDWMGWSENESYMFTGNVARSLVKKYNTEASLTALGYTPAEINHVMSNLNFQKAYTGNNERENTDPAYTFQLANSDKTFVMLDKNDANEMFVITKDSYGSHQYETVANKTFMDYTDTNKIYNWLENSFITAGNTDNGVTYKLPDAIINHLVESTWYSEPSVPNDDMKMARKSTAKLSFLSVTEWLKYKSFLGARDDFGDDNGADSNHRGWWIRSNVSGNGNDHVSYIRSSATHRDGDPYPNNSIGSASKLWWNTSMIVRPCFFMDKTFVLNEKLNTTTLGVNVKTYIKSNYTRNDFETKALYTEKELDDIFGKPMQVNSYAFLNNDNTPATVLVGNSVIKVSYNISNNSKINNDATAIVCCYDKTTNQLKAVGFNTLNIAATATDTVESQITLPADVTNVKVIGYLWKDFTTMRSLTEQVLFTPAKQ